MSEWRDPYRVVWYFRRGRRGELRFADYRLAARFAEGLKRAQRPLVIATIYDGKETYL